MKPCEYAMMADDDAMSIKDFTNIKNQGDKLRQTISLQLNGDFISTIQNRTLVEDYPSVFSWRALFLKLCFEQMLEYFP